MEDYKRKDYWQKRKNLNYYREVVNIAKNYKGSVIDIGSANVPLLKDLDFKRKVAIDKNLLPELKDVKCIKNDFMTYQFKEKFNLGICLQTLEHVPDPKDFVKKIFSICDNVIISIPYKWKEYKEHLHHSIDEKKLFEWVGQNPIQFKFSDGRLIAVYKRIKKALIVVISDKKIGKECLNAIHKQDYPNYEVLEQVKKPDGKHKCENIIINRNIARERALKTDAEYFFLVDSDVILPKNALSNLMLQLDQLPYNPEIWRNLIQDYAGKNNISYKEAVKRTTPPKKHIMGGWYKLTRKLWSPSRWVADNTLVSLSKVEPSVVIVDKIGLGCILISREILEKVKFRLDYKLIINEDGQGYQRPCMCTMFGIDAQDAGYTLYMDGSVICKHLKQGKCL